MLLLILSVKAFALDLILGSTGLPQTVELGERVRMGHAVNYNVVNDLSF